MQLFYSKNISNNIITLDEGESMHCIKVLRKKRGDRIHILDGIGNLYETIIIEEHPKACKLEIANVITAENRAATMHIAISPTKTGDRWEWFLEKATEIGVDEITPIICERTERSKVNLERAEKILVSAIKQSKNLYLPKMNEAISLKKFLSDNSDLKAGKFIAHCEEVATNHLQEEYKAGNNMLILIGPEGDFSENEIAMARDNNYTGVSLGGNRLRTETAGIVACHTFKLLNLKSSKDITL